MPRTMNPQSTEEGGVNKPDTQNSTVERNTPNVDRGAQQSEGGQTPGAQMPKGGTGDGSNQTQESDS